MSGSVAEFTSKTNEETKEDESIITMVDVLEEEKKLEEDAFAVLGASDDVNCTYDQGYVKRQALYACKTCYDISKNVAGICLACSYQCHEGHDLIELYTKRNFRCDCGNDLFGEKKCNLQKDKDSLNADNNYNQNFRGVYCICARPYPDPDDDTMDEMIQCIVCEDWYHTRHLNGAVVPDIDDYSEMMCHFCTEKLSSFLAYYRGYAVTKVKSNVSGDDKEIDVDNSITETGSTLVNGSNASVTPVVAVSDEGDVKSKPADDSGIVGLNNSDKLSSGSVKNDHDLPARSNDIVDTNCQDCKLKSLKKPADGFNGATFWREGFRNILCRCDSCQDLYKNAGVSYLIDPLDTVQAYEEEGEMKRNKSHSGPGSGSGYEQGMKALSTLDRIKQVEAIHRYNEMQEHLKAYLAKFAENKKVVRAEDIKEFFNGMQTRKRQKVEVPYFCH